MRAGASLPVAVYGSTERSTLPNGTPTASVRSLPVQSGARILFSAPDTDHFVIEDPYPISASRGLHRDPARVEGGDDDLA